ncbi:MAG: 16S rRNA (uracil(1498)-N(3))-methyltransferase [Puniceicoccales bacterium]|jgi:16S rRNA (uracil1498-N3)-methyltransferase|nr:16S rRNA (uracil(1498)-N(3))-methyltransferase [Puniceicoccales bacterium]
MSTLLRCFVPQNPPWEVGQSTLLPPTEAHHLLHVLRAKNGAEIQLLDGRGAQALAHLEIHRNQARAQVRGITSTPASKHPLILAQALGKHRAMDTLIREASALGVNQIVPLLTEHGEGRIPLGQEGRKSEHWRSIAIAACKQSGQPFLPEISLPRPLMNYLSSLPAEPNLPLVASLEPGAEGLWNVLESTASGKTIGPFVLFIGPAGDFSPEEYRLLAAKGVRAVRLSRRVLRAETAGAYALSVIDQWLQFHEDDPGR